MTRAHAPRQVFEDDRRIAEAWARGGREAEAAEREAIKQERSRPRIEHAHL
jgi:hypothetical protein